MLLPAATDLATSDATKLFELTAYASALDFILGPSKQASETIWVSFADPQQFITDFSTDSTLTVATVTVVLFESVVATSLDAEITVNGLAYSPDSIFLPDAGVELDGSWVRCFDTIDLVFNQPIGQTVSKVTLSDFWTIHGVFIPSASLTK